MTPQREETPSINDHPSEPSRSAGRDLKDVYAAYDASPAVRSRWSGENPGNAAMLRERECVLENMLRSRAGTPLEQCRVLDAGCGWGHLMGWLARVGVPAGNLTGVDVMPNRLVSARASYPEFEFIEADLSDPGLASESVDLVVCSTLFSSIMDDAMAARVASNLRRLLCRDGAVVWYDIRYPNPWNRAVRPLGRGAIRRLFPDLVPSLRSLTLLPQLSRRLGPAIGAYPLLAELPPLRTHLGGLLETAHA